jgi:hypothetical protein
VIEIIKEPIISITGRIDRYRMTDENANEKATEKAAEKATEKAAKKAAAKAAETPTE